MGDAVAVLLLCEFEDGLGDDRARERGAERIALIVRVGAHRVETELCELLGGVDDVLFDAQCLGGLLGLLELVVGLANVDGNADDLVVAVLFVQQRYADCRVEPAREGERDGSVSFWHDVFESADVCRRFSSNIGLSSHESRHGLLPNQSCCDRYCSNGSSLAGASSWGELNDSLDCPHRFDGEVAVFDVFQERPVK